MYVCTRGAPHQKTNEQGAQNGHEIVSRVRRVQEVHAFLQHQRGPNQREGADDFGNLAHLCRMVVNHDVD